RGGQHQLVNFAELLLCAVALDHHSAAQLSITGGDLRIEAKETAQIDISLGRNLQLVQCNSLQCAERRIADDHAGVQSGQQVLLGIRKGIAPAQLEWLIEVDRKTARHIDAADRKPVDLRSRARAALPSAG